MDQNALEKINTDNKGIAFVRKLFGIQQCEDEEVISFIVLCEQYGFDPRLRQVSCWEQYVGNQWTLIINVNVGAWLEKANQHEAFDGIESGVVYEGDTFQRFPGGKYEHKHGDMHGSSSILGAYAVVHRRDRSIPTFKYASFETYRQDKKSWKTYGEAMIEKVAVVRAIRESFSISGTYSPEETEGLMDSEVVKAEKVEVIPQEKNVDWRESFHNYLGQFHRSVDEIEGCREYIERMVTSYAMGAKMSESEWLKGKAKYSQKTMGENGTRFDKLDEWIVDMMDNFLLNNADEEAKEETHEPETAAAS